MTQPIGTDLEGAQSDAPQPIPAPQDTPRPELEGIDLRGLSEKLRPVPAPEPPLQATDDDGDPEEDADTEPEEEGQPEGQQRPTRTVEEWEAILSAQPQRLNELPGKMRVQVLQRAQAAKSEAESTSRVAGYSAGREFERDLALARDVAAIDAASEDNPDGFAEWVREHPERYAAYQQHRPRLMSKYRMDAADLVKQAETQPAGPSMEQRLIEKATEIVQPLHQYPAAKARIAQNHYSNDLDGVMRLAADVAREVEVERLKDETPARARKQAATDNPSKPRPIVAAGGAGQGETTAAALKAMTPEQVMELRKTPEGRAAVDRALARS